MRDCFIVRHLNSDFTDYFHVKEVNQVSTNEVHEVIFSDLEKEIIKLIIQEIPNKEIARRLNYSQRNIEYSISNIMEKLNVATRVGIVVEVYKRKLLQD